jgi:hypothetical protein
MKPVFSGLFALMTFLGCGTPNHVREFTAIGSVTSFTLSRHRESPETTKITGKAAISEVVDFVDAHRTGWGTPWYGIPVPAVTVEFYDGTEFKGSFGVGDNFFETQRDGGFFTQSASPAEVLGFLRLVSLHSDSSITPIEREHVLDGDFRIITSISELPIQLKTAFAALTKESGFEMADPGHAFQLTDVIGEPGFPRRRLKFAGISPEQMFLHYEMGGRGHAYYLVVFTNSQPETKLIWGGTLPKLASILAQLQVGVYTQSGPPISHLSF